MTQVLATATGLFRDRDFFVHDGAKLRRFRISATAQIVGFAILFSLVAWSSYAVGRLITSSPAIASKIVAGENYSAQLAELTAETERRVQLIEQRQMALAAALADEDIDPASLKKLGFYPSSNFVHVDVGRVRRWNGS